MGPLDNQLLDIPCQNCRHVTKKSIGWVKTNCQFTCVCGTKIILDTDQFRRQIADLERRLGKLGQFK